MHPCEMPLITSCTNCTVSPILACRCACRLYLVASGADTGFFPNACHPSDTAEILGPRGLRCNARMSESVHVESVGAVTVVTLNRPEVRNAVDAATARLLYDAFIAFEADAAARVAVFHGANGHFCAGWD